MVISLLGLGRTIAARHADATPLCTPHRLSTDANAMGHTSCVLSASPTQHEMASDSAAAKQGDRKGDGDGDGGRALPGQARGLRGLRRRPWRRLSSDDFDRRDHEEATTSEGLQRGSTAIGMFDVQGWNLDVD